MNWKHWQAMKSQLKQFFVVIIVVADGPALVGARISAGSVLTEDRSHIYILYQHLNDSGTDGRAVGQLVK